MSIVALYSDAGMLSANPSTLGGSWAYVLVDAAGERVEQRSGVVTSAEFGMERLSNNFCETYAALLGLEALPDGWHGDVYTDNSCAESRLKYRGTMRGSECLEERMEAAKRRLGKFCVNLLGGHPTIEELTNGQRADGTPVSHHNACCDRLAAAAAREWHRKRNSEKVDLTKAMARA